MKAESNPWLPGQTLLPAYLFKSPNKFLECFISDSLLPPKTGKLIASFILLQSRERSCLVKIKQQVIEVKDKGTRGQQQCLSPLIQVLQATQNTSNTHKPSDPAGTSRRLPLPSQRTWLAATFTHTCIPRSFILANASSRRLPCSTPELTRGIGMSL